MYVQSGKKRVYLDDPKERQRYVKYMTPKQKERFAKSYIRSILEGKEQDLFDNHSAGVSGTIRCQKGGHVGYFAGVGGAPERQVFR